ncbi:hypothetical protein GF323_00645 [Candidatus Woesearchaeota archaeon]|nr:hypothetical protein [Candidatus Woesearchaeota archaeon]
MRKNYTKICPKCAKSPIREKRYFRVKALKSKFGYMERCMTCGHFIRK